MKKMKTKEKKAKSKQLTARERILKALEFIAEDHDAEIMLLGNPPECVEAIVGVAYRDDAIHVVYSESKYIKGLMKANNWTMDEAREWYEFNTVRSLAYQTNPNKPVFIDTDFTDVI